MKKKVIRLNENDIENLVKKIIKEEKLDEVGGYDSFELGSSHSKSTMESIRDAYEVMVDTVEHLNSLKLDILDDKLSMATKRLVGRLSSSLEEYSKYWTEAEKRRIGRFR